MCKGYLYPSKTEAHCRMMLDDRVRRGEYAEVRNQVEIPLLIGDRWHTQTYTMDFVAIRKRDGLRDFWEAKGYEREYWKGRRPFVVAILLNHYPGCGVWIYESDGKIRRAVVKDARKRTLTMPVFGP